MRVSKVVAVLLFVCTSLSWGQYSTRYLRGVSDTSNQFATKNAWVAFRQGGPSNQICHIAGFDLTLSIGNDGTVWCIGPGQYIWSTTSGATSWTEHPEMGQTRTSVTAGNAQLIYGIGSTPCSLGKWTGSGWQGIPGCLTQLKANPDGSLLGINSPYTYRSIKGDGSDWASLAGGNYFTYVNSSSQDVICGVGSGHVYYWNGSTFVQMSVQPSGTVQGCTIKPDISNGTTLLLFTWSTTGVVSIYNYTNGNWDSGSWSTVTGLSVSQVITAGKAMTIALDAGGHPYHLNWYARYFNATTSGSYNGCPVQTCPNSVTHTLTIQATLPHGLYGAQGKITGSPTYNLSTSSYDVGLQCDPFFGDPSDQNCIPTVTGDAHCDFSGADLGGPGPVPTINESVDAVGFSGRIITSGYVLVTPEFYIGDALCSALIDACAPLTSPACSGTTQAVDVQAVSVGPNASGVLAQAAAQNACTTEGAAPNAWKVEIEYEGSDLTTCTAKIVVPIPLGHGTIDCF